MMTFNTAHAEKLNVDGLPEYPPAPKRLRGIIAIYFGLQFCVNFAFGAVTQFLVPLNIGIVDPKNRVIFLGMVATATAVASLIVQPLTGWLSDSTRSSWGRRAPWILGGLVGSAIALVLFSFAASIPAILVLSISFAIAYSASAAPLFAVLADRTPVKSRGTVSALGGLGQWIGVLAGILVASNFVAQPAIGFLVFAAVSLVAGIPLAILLRRNSRELPRQASLNFGGFLKQFWVSPRKYPDFAWAFVARVALACGYSVFSAFILYTLEAYLKMSQQDAAAILPLVALLTIGGILVAVYPAGLISDKLGRRKPIVIAGSLLIGVTGLIPIAVPSVPAYLVTFFLLGVGFGAYIAVDQALMTQVLPSSSAVGKDLGILNIATAGGQMLAPGIGAIAISVGGYQTMFVVASVLAVIGGIAVLPIRTVR